MRSIITVVREKTHWKILNNFCTQLIYSVIIVMITVTMIMITVATVID
jgi:hypothetical protein